MTHEHTPTRTYVFVWIGLLCLTDLTTAMGEIDLGRWNVFVALLIAGCKALVVVWFFMHINHSTALNKLVVFGGLFWFGLLLTFTFADYLTRAWQPLVQPW